MRSGQRAARVRGEAVVARRNPGHQPLAIGAHRQRQVPVEAGLPAGVMALVQDQPGRHPGLDLQRQARGCQRSGSSSRLAVRR